MPSPGRKSSATSRAPAPAHPRKNVPARRRLNASGRAPAALPALAGARCRHPAPNHHPEAKPQVAPEAQLSSAFRSGQSETASEPSCISRRRRPHWPLLKPACWSCASQQPPGELDDENTNASATGPARAGDAAGVRPTSSAVHIRGHAGRKKNREGRNSSPNKVNGCSVFQERASSQT